jgi:hypothetical protein
MRAEERWLHSAMIWLAAIFVVLSGPVWLAAAVAGLCVGMAFKIHRDRTAGPDTPPRRKPK